MTFDTGTEFVLAYMLVSVGVIAAFGVAVFMIGWFVGRLHERRRPRRRDKGSTQRRGARASLSIFSAQNHSLKRNTPIGALQMRPFLRPPRAPPHRALPRHTPHPAPSSSFFYSPGGGTNRRQSRNLLDQGASRRPAARSRQPAARRADRGLCRQANRIVAALRGKIGEPCRLERRPPEHREKSNSDAIRKGVRQRKHKVAEGPHGKAVLDELMVEARAPGTS
jgi:hypothetical protein